MKRSLFVYQSTHETGDARWMAEYEYARSQRWIRKERLRSKLIARYFEISERVGRFATSTDTQRLDKAFDMRLARRWIMGRRGFYEWLGIRLRRVGRGQPAIVDGLQWFSVGMIG
jgi:hypothetical protein